MAVLWRNPSDSLDVNNDHFIAADDVITLINDINARGSRQLPDELTSGRSYLDPTGDQVVAADDVIKIINAINAGIGDSGRRQLKESGRLSTEKSVEITVGQFSGSRVMRVGLTAVFDTTDQQTSLEDVLSVHLVNPSNLFEDPPPPLFQLAGSHVDFVPGVVRWDGSVLEVDLSKADPNLANLDTASLRFQLLSSDSDFGTQVTITPLSNELNSDEPSDLTFDDSQNFAAIGGPLNLASLTTTTDVEAIVENVQLNPITLRYTADIRLRNNGAPIGRDVAAIFRGLFQVPGFLIVDVENRSGSTSDGQFPEPYINFRNAIPSGGLQRGMTSEAITVRFFDPQEVTFFIRPEIKASANRAPVLNAIGPLNVMPGSVLTVPLSATDADGDTVKYSVIPNGPMPTSELTADGKLIFRPSPAQLGTYTFNVIASDGALQTTRTVTLNVVTDPDTTTRVSGTVLKTNGQPLAGVRVDVGPVQVVTAANGTFTANLGTGSVVSDTLKIRGELLAGATTYPFIAEKLAFIFEHPVYEQYNNVIVRPIYLPGLDTANAVQIDPAQDTMVTTAAIPGAAVMVKAGTLMNQQGTPFTGKLSITEVPRELTPATLPSGMRPDLVVTIQPGEMVFAAPAPLSFPNRANYPPGTAMELWSINPVSGEFDKVGLSVVSADGSTIDTVSGGIRNSSWHFPVPIEPVPDLDSPLNQDDGCNDCKKTGQLTSEVELHSGAVIERHDLVTYQAEGAMRGLSLTYDSLRADPRPIISFSAEQVPDSPPNCATAPVTGPCFIGQPIPTPTANTRYVASLAVQNGSFTQQVPGYAGTIPGLSNGQHFFTYSNTQQVDASLQADLRSFSTGIYRYTVTSGFLTGDSNGFAGSLNSSSSSLISVNSINSPFGAGWGLAGLQNIVTGATTALLVDGDGSQLRFGGSGDGLYTSPPGDFSKFERINGLFQRTTPDKTVYQFNANNQIDTITDRYGNITTYQYTGTHLDKIIDSVGLETTFTYTGSRVTKITDPAGRMTTLAYDSAGNLASITDPDTAQRTWEYDVDHHIVAEVDQLGRRETTEYGFHGRAIGGVKKDGGRIEVSAVQTKGLLPPSKTSDPLNSPAVIQRRSTQATYLDPNGTISATPLDRYGQAQAERDRIGMMPSVSRNASNLPITLLDGRGNPTIQSFDQNGMLTSRRDSVSGGGTVTGSIAPAGEVDRYTFTGRAGQRLFIDGPRGSFNSSVVVYDSGGRFVAFAETFTADFPFYFSMPVLPHDDVYSITVQPQPNNNPLALPGETGSYQFRLIDVEQAAELPLDTALVGSLSESQFFKVTGQRGQRLKIADLLTPASGQGSVFPIVFDPFGQKIERPFTGDIYAPEFLLPSTGSYIVMLPGFSDPSVRRYEFGCSLLNPPSVPKQNIDVDLTGILPNTLTLSAPPGTPILPYWFDKGPHALEAFDPGDSRFLTASSSGVFSVPASGTIRFNLTRTPFGYAGELDEYAIRFVDLSAVPLASIGATVTGSLNQTGRVAVHRFSAQVGQRIDFGVPLPGTSVSVFLPQSLFSENAYNVVTLPQTGEYVVAIYQTQFATTPTNYSFSLLPQPAPTPILLDAAVSGQLLPGGGRKYFELAVAAGDNLYFEDLGSSSQIKFYNQQLEGNPPHLNSGPTIADVERRYFFDRPGKLLIILDAEAADRPASYNFKFHSAKNSTAPLTLGQATVATFNQPIQTNIYTFSGTAGQQLFFDQLDGASSLNLSSNLVSPASSQNLLQQFSFDSGRMIVLPATGTYQLQVSNYDATPGTASFRLLDVATAPLAVLGTPQSGTIDPADEADLYRFSVTAGQRVRFEMTAGAAQVFPTFFYPNGESLDTLGNPVSLPISFTGGYAVSLRGNAGAVPYQFVITNVSDTPVAPVNIEQLYSGTGDGSEATVGTFSASAGTVMFLDAQTGQGILKVYDASGTVVGRYIGDESGFTAHLNNDVFLTLPTSGQYTVKVQTDGDFSFRLRPANAAPLINFTQNVTGTLAAPNISDLYRFDVLPGQTLRFDRTDGDTDVDFKFYTPTGSQDFGFGFFAPSQTPTTLFTPGTYFVAASRIFQSGPYGFQIRDFDDAPAINIGETVAGTASPASQAILRKFQGVAGQKIYLNSSGGLWQLYDSQHRYVGAVYDAGILTLPKTDTYTLDRDNDDLVESAEFSFTLSVLDDPLTTIEPAYLSSSALTMQYDPNFSQVTNVTDELGHTTLFDIDPANGNTRSITRFVGAVGGADDQITTMTYLPSGLVDTMTDPLGRITDYDYDSRRRLITVTSAKSTPSQTIVRYEYDTVGNVSAYIDENNRRTAFEYDAVNRLKKVTEADPDGAGPLASPITQFTYDLAGNRLTMTDANRRVSSLAYDALDRMKSMTDPGNNTTKYAYDSLGNLLSVTDPLNQLSEYRYDERNRLKESVDPAGKITKYKYDLSDNLISLTDASGNVTTFEYDARNRLTRRVDPLGKATTYSYDAADNLRTMVDRLGRVSELTYDDLDRLVQEVWKNATGSVINTITYAYDLADNLLQAQDNYSTVAYAHDSLDRVTQTQTGGSGGIPSATLGYTYDAVGNRLSVVDTINGLAGATNTYTYDTLDRVTRIVQAGTGVATKRVDMQYNPLGQMTSLARFSDAAGTSAVATSTFVYDTLNRTSSITHRNPANNVLDSFAYQYDAASRITRITDIDGVTNYTYNTRDELVGANHADPANPDENYAYDATGNRLSSHKHGSGYDIGDGPGGATDNNRLASDGTYNYSYDDEGNLTKRVHIASGAVREFAYDHRNRLLQVTDKPSAAGAATQVVKYVYDLFGRRIAKNVDASPADVADGVFTTFIYDGDDVLVEYRDPDGSGPTASAESLRYLHGPAVDQVLAQEDATGAVQWHLTDHLGTVRDLVNNTGQVVNHLKYDSYGNLISESNPAISTRYRFTGREFDSETSLMYYRARYYDTTNGRFLSEDPIGLDSGDENLFMYIKNRPLDQRDPSGKLPPVVFIALGAVTAGAVLLRVTGNDPIEFFISIGSIKNKFETAAKRNGAADTSRVPSNACPPPNTFRPHKSKFLAYDPAPFTFREKFADFLSGNKYSLQIAAARNMNKRINEGLVVKGVQVDRGIQSPIQQNEKSWDLKNKLNGRTPG